MRNEGREAELNRLAHRIMDEPDYGPGDDEKESEDWEDEYDLDDFDDDDEEDWD